MLSDIRIGHLAESERIGYFFWQRTFSVQNFVEYRSRHSYRFCEISLGAIEGYPASQNLNEISFGVSLHS
jgi:hypothetical protein